MSPLGPVTDSVAAGLAAAEKSSAVAHFRELIELITITSDVAPDSFYVFTAANGSPNLRRPLNQIFRDCGEIREGNPDP
jgi:hypothetical protein